MNPNLTTDQLLQLLDGIVEKIDWTTTPYNPTTITTTPYVYDIPEDFEFHKAGSRLQRFAKFLVKIRIAGIQRLGQDILEEY